MNYHYFVLALAIVMNAFANIFVKVAMRQVGTHNTFTSFVFSVVRIPMIWIGIFCFATALGAYSIVLSKLNLSVAYPIMVSMGLVIVVLVSWLFLNETIRWSQVVGFVLIFAGVWLVAR